MSSQQDTRAHSPNAPFSTQTRVIALDYAQRTGTNGYRTISASAIDEIAAQSAWQHLAGRQLQLLPPQRPRTPRAVAALNTALRVENPISFKRSHWNMNSQAVRNRIPDPSSTTNDVKDFSHAKV